MEADVDALVSLILFVVGGLVCAMIACPILAALFQRLVDRAADREMLTPEEEEILRMDEERYGGVAPRT